MSKRPSNSHQSENARGPLACTLPYCIVLSSQHVWQTTEPPVNSVISARTECRASHMMCLSFILGDNCTEHVPNMSASPNFPNTGQETQILATHHVAGSCFGPQDYLQQIITSISNQQSAITMTNKATGRRSCLSRHQKGNKKHHRIFNSIIYHLCTLPILWATTNMD